MTEGWHFTDAFGTFSLPDPDQTSDLYFPLVNEAGLMSSITPWLHGDCKTGQNSFLMAPVSVADLRDSRAARNFWVYVEGNGAWSATGNAARQIAQRFTPDAERVTLSAGFLWHTIIRASVTFGLRAEITNFVPPSDDTVELMQVALTNISNRTLDITCTAAIPIYARSADNLRDHRHVTSLLHRITTHTHGVLVRPTQSFDERGHRPNTLTYGILGSAGDGTPPQGFFPLIANFIGEGGCLDYPRAVVLNSNDFVSAGQKFAGHEAMGALRFHPTTLKPGESATYVVLLAVMRENENPDHLIEKYASRAHFGKWFERNREHWRHMLDTLAFHTGDTDLNGWLKWVSLEPILRRVLGNSFLPHHDYGRGGRGWRDLWQDCLALLIMEPDRVPELLFSSFAGIRMDGSNATIIGAAPGEFLADRNNIARIWMDHGTWPWLTTQLYINQTGDLEFLLREQTYFKDQHTCRSREIDGDWKPAHGTQQRTANDQAYRGSLLEHLLVQHLTAFFNVGEHNAIKLEDADWNDGMDMAPNRGESVAFSALYASNLRDLAEFVLELDRRGITHVTLASELIQLLDTLGERVNYASPANKRARLREYFATCRHTLAGRQTQVAARDLARDLAAKADWLCEHLRTQEWIRNRDGFAWFNGYYDDDGNRVEGDHPNGVRMTLTGQVFALMGGIATDEQACEIVRAAKRYLFDASIGGYRLNTNFGETLLNLGRCFGFAFGTKENGAMFSHMAIMYANALYRRGLVREGFTALDQIYRHCRDFQVSRIYPGIPEYINAEGRGVYHYLTGSASWLLLTMLTETFGVKGKLGDLVIEPKLVREQFDGHGQASVETQFAGKQLRITFHNPNRLDYGEYRIHAVSIDDQAVPFERQADAIVLSRETIIRLADHSRHNIQVTLTAHQL